MNGRPKGAERLMVALDAPSEEENLALVDALGGEVSCFKVGLRSYCAGAERLMAAVRGTGSGLFLDLKLHDIPKTVEGAARALAAHRPRWLTVHASGGKEMVEGAVAGLVAGGSPETGVLGVTVLTSLDSAATKMLWGEGDVSRLVAGLARAAQAGGAAGVVCSGSEAGMLRREFPGLGRVVPGIRPAGAAWDDQSRVLTPAAAVAEGADWLVVGRPIWQAADPVGMWRRLVEEFAAVEAD